MATGFQFTTTDKYPRLLSVMSVLFQALSEAKDVLIDAEARKWYDELLQQQRKQGGRGGWRQNEAMGVRGNRDGAGNGGGEELAVPYSGRQLGMLASSSRPVRYGNYVMSRNIAQDNENRNRPQMSLQACLGSGTNMHREKEAYRGKRQFMRGRRLVYEGNCHRIKDNLHLSSIYSRGRDMSWWCGATQVGRGSRGWRMGRAGRVSVNRWGGVGNWKRGNIGVAVEAFLGTRNPTAFASGALERCNSEGESAGSRPEHSTSSGFSSSRGFPRVEGKVYQPDVPGFGVGRGMTPLRGLGDWKRDSVGAAKEACLGGRNPMALASGALVRCNRRGESAGSRPEHNNSSGFFSSHGRPWGGGRVYRSDVPRFGAGRGMTPLRGMNVWKRDIVGSAKKACLGGRNPITLA